MYMSIHELSRVRIDLCWSSFDAMIPCQGPFMVSVEILCPAQASFFLNARVQFIAISSRFTTWAALLFEFFKSSCYVFLYGKISLLKSNDQWKRCSLQALTYCPMTIQGALSQYDMDMLDARTEARAKAHFQNPTGSSAENKSNLCPSRLMSIRNQFLCDSYLFYSWLTI